MTCYTVRGQSTARTETILREYEAKHGRFPREGEHVKLFAEYERKHGPDPHADTWTMCGDFGPACADCGGISDALCDFPVGKGKTCDRAICEDCAPEVGANFNYCKAHRAEWQAFKAQHLPEMLFARVGVKKRKPHPKRPMLVK